MLTKRIVPCLDIKNGRTVKGINFLGLRDAGDPVELALTYAEAGADELVFLDITATNERRGTLLPLVTQVAKVLNIPFTVGGGVNSVAAAKALLDAGADKIATNSAALANPQLIDELSAALGAQCVVLAIDAKPTPEGWLTYSHGGSKPTDRFLMEWAAEGVVRGAGEILFTAMDRDGTKKGFANAPLQQLNALSVPIIASGGAGSMEDFADAFIVGKADAALAASVFHFGEIEVPALKDYLSSQNIPIRKTVSL